MIDIELLKGNQILKVAWNVYKMPLLICEFYLHWTNHSYSCGQQLTAVPACSSTQLYCSAAENSADGQHWRPTRRHFSSYPNAKPIRTQSSTAVQSPEWRRLAHGVILHQLRVMVPLSSWDHTTCETREPLSPRATAESSSSSNSCCSEERISQCRSDGVVICPCRCPAGLTMEIWAATWPMYIYLYGRNHGLSGHGAPYLCPILRTRVFQLRTRSGTSHSTRWSIYTSYLE